MGSYKPKTGISKHASHSMTPKQVAGLSISEVVAPDAWQAIRVSLKGHWVADHLHNVQILKNYLDACQWSALSVRQVLNVLTGSVHRYGHTRGQKETDALRKAVRIKWAELLGMALDWNDPKIFSGII